MEHRIPLSREEQYAQRDRRGMRENPLNGVVESLCHSFMLMHMEDSGLGTRRAGRTGSFRVSAAVSLTQDNVDSWREANAVLDLFCAHLLCPSLKCRRRRHHHNPVLSKNQMEAYDWNRNTSCYTRSCRMTGEISMFRHSHMNVHLATSDTYLLRRNKT